MIFGLDGLTAFHVLISLVAIATGFMVVGGFLANRRLECVTLTFFATTVVTNATGFLFPFSRLLPSHILAIISLVVLAGAIYAYYGARLVGSWRWIYTALAILALYLNVFVLIIQTFLKNPALAALAPTQTEPTFVAAQGVTLLGFLWVGYLAISRFKDAPR